VIRVLHVITQTARGGLETTLMNYYRNIDRSEIQFDFLKHRNEHEAFDDEIISLGGRIFSLPRMNPFSSDYLNALNFFFVSHPEYKIVHVHQDCMSSIMLKAAKRNGVPVRIAHGHSSGQDKNIKYPIKLYYRSQITKYATELFACSKDAGNWMFKGADFKLLKNAINTDSYTYSSEIADSIRSMYSISKDSFVIGNIGRFHKVKNHSFLIDVFVEIKKINNNAVLLLIGDGELKSQLKSKVNDLKLADSVIFAGICDNVNEILNAMDVFVMPSLYEGFPVSLLEAQANGLPCFISDSLSKECDITKAITRVSLNSSPKDWAGLICSETGKPRLSTTSDIYNKGFDIKVNAQWLKDYYFAQWKNVIEQ